MPNQPQRRGGLLPVPDSPVRRLDISKSAPGSPGRQQTPNSRIKDFEGAPVRDATKVVPIIPGYVSLADRNRYRAGNAPPGSLAFHNGEYYHDPEHRFRLADQQADRIRSQFARTRRDPGVRPQLQDRVANAVDNPQALAFLDMLGLAEGNLAWRGRGGAQWDSAFGDLPGRRRQLPNFNAHPGNSVGARFGNAAQSAAGRYQIQGGAPDRIYDEIGPLIGISDFSPQSQNAVALAILANRRGMLASIERGNLQEAFKNASHYWASLPVGPTAGAGRDNGRYEKDGNPQRAPFTYDELLAEYKRRLIAYEGGNPNGRMLGDPVAFDQ